MKTRSNVAEMGRGWISTNHRASVISDRLSDWSKYAHGPSLMGCIEINDL